ncbi:four-carbon acid sugar kinase family protein [Haloferax volcanii]|uniref:D-threonate kinase n=2 Tax=Haloferax volcanii TaxID=2246 RepID=D4GUQ9_HALVD|nr:four-carbon acid sugar kinase family protein [Haloferax volcanii]ADE03049.1 putative D-threonate kinase [Haloferax volcanii DS2]MBS8119266.1 four-carbon acid sugar kinase family protein [Haloferax volcanii]MBS8124279.1 four-carbon acid sugar kinase family protein [Haloferax volcanii]MBS8128148.1 four-carbon acid sugar kinase family protein [Haloferax volcanii]MBS8132013.1 four-carbon acid sugar kinase family protein [Haloferax volcanii]
MTELNAVVIADDITGANDTGSQFASRGYRTNVVFDPSAPTSCDVLVVDTETREAPPAAAYETVRAAVSQHDTTLLYNKLDSTLRGNVTDELAAVLDAATPDILLLAPAFPSNGRTTEDGVQLVDGDPVVETLTDSENLPATSSVVELLSSLAYPVETLPLDVVTKGTGHVRSKLAEIDRNRDGPVVVVADATTHTHLRSLADAASRLTATVAYAGSGGLAGALSRSTAVSGGQSVLGVVGSVSETSFGQLARVPDQAIVALDPETMLERPTEAASEAVGPVLAAQRAHGFAIVTSAPSSRAVDEVTRNADALGLDEHAVKDRIATTLRATVRGVHETRPLAGLFTTGGSTTIAVLDELDAESLELTGIELDDGIPLTRIRGGAADETLLVTKAGSFGDPTTIVNCLDFIGTP